MAEVECEVQINLENKAEMDKLIREIQVITEMGSKPEYKLQKEIVELSAAY